MCRHFAAVGTLVILRGVMLGIMPHDHVSLRDAAEYVWGLFQPDAVTD